MEPTTGRRPRLGTHVPAPTNKLLLLGPATRLRRDVLAHISAAPTTTLVAVAQDLRHTAGLVRKHPADVVVLDGTLDREAAIHAAQEATAAGTTAGLVMIVDDATDRSLVDAVRAGVRGVIGSQQAASRLAEVCAMLVNGQAVISPSLASAVIDEIEPQAPLVVGLPDTDRPRLTDRELEVLRLLAHGKPNRDIATDLFISENTVKNHVRNILDKLQLHTRTEAVVYAVRQRIVTLT